MTNETVRLRASPFKAAIRLPDDGTAWPTNRVAAACALDAIRVANGEAP